MSPILETVSEFATEPIERLETQLNRFPGNAYEITQPIQMRFNELIAGVRGDIAIKVFGDDFHAMNRTAEQIAAIMRKTPGATDVKVEQTSGLPMLDIRVNRDAMARLGVTAQDVQERRSVVDQLRQDVPGIPHAVASHVGRDRTRHWQAGGVQLGQ